MSREQQYFFEDGTPIFPFRKSTLSESALIGLLACPFCGEYPHVELIEQGPNNPEFYVECQNDNCTVNPGLGDSCREHMKTRWNTRAC
jgi:hypothetical protein